MFSLVKMTEPYPDTIVYAPGASFEIPNCAWTSTLMTFFGPCLQVSGSCCSHFHLSLKGMEVRGVCVEACHSMLWLRMKARGMGGEKKRRREGKLPGMQAAKITPHINQGERATLILGTLYLHYG